MTDSIVLQRQFGGIGDWLFMLACIRLINDQRPDVVIYVDWRTTHEPLPTIVPELYGLSNAIYRTDEPPAGSARIEHVVYRRRPGTFIESMLLQINNFAGLAIEYRHSYPQIRAPRPRDWGNYVCMIGHGKHTRRTGKCPGFAFFDELARSLSRFSTVLQLGAKDDQRLAAADSSLIGADGDTLARALRGSRGYVGIENGLMVLAGFMAVPQITLYNGVGSPERVDFAEHTKILKPQHPEETCAEILRRF